MSVFRRHTTIAALLIVGLSACASSDSPESPSAPPALDLVATEYDAPILAEEIDAVDENKNDRACVKQTPSGHLVYKDDNEATPSQPCPPAFQSKAKGESIKILKEWFSEDQNGNGVICVKSTANGGYVVKDDNTATPSQPCPPAFSVAGKLHGVPEVPIKDLKSADDNQNDQVCVLVLPSSGNFVLKDDNAATPSQPCPPAYVLERIGDTMETEEESTTKG